MNTPQLVALRSENAWLWVSAFSLEEAERTHKARHEVGAPAPHGVMISGTGKTVSQAFELDFLPFGRVGLITTLHDGR